MKNEANNIGKTLCGTFLAIVSCVSSLRSLTQERWLCWSMIGVSVALLGLAVYWRTKEEHADRVKLFIVCSLIMIAGSAYKLHSINETEDRVELWQSFVDNRYTYTGGYYFVDNPPSDGPAQMDVARRSLAEKDYKTAREYAEKALGQGVGEAASLLIDIYYYGLGVEHDLHQCVKYLLAGMEVGYMEWSDEFLVILEKEDYVFTERERMLLDKRLKDNDFLFQVMNEVAEASCGHRKNISKILKKYHNRLEEMSLSGSATATFFLYEELLEEEWNNGGLTEESFSLCWKYCDMLMSADYLPTDPYSRIQACIIHDGRQDYKASNVDYFIKHNVYPELCPDKGVCNSYHESSLINDMGEDEYLFAKYRLYRAQYEYCKSFFNSTRRRNILLCYQYDIDYSLLADYQKARNMLEEVIQEVFLAMPILGNDESVGTNDN